MKKSNYIFILLIFFYQLVEAQTLYDDYENYLTPFKTKYEVKISQLIRFGFDDIFKYNSNDLNFYKDSIHVLNKIKRVTIELNDSTNLEKIINHLTLIPNLKQLKFKNISFFKKDLRKITFPENLNRLSNLETVIFFYYNDWDFDDGFTKLSKIKKLKNICFYGFSEDILLSDSFKKIKNLEGLFFSSNIGPKIPSNLSQLKSLVLSVSSYPNIDSEFNKLSKIKTLENFVLAYLRVNDTVSKSFQNFHSLKRINLSNSVIDSPSLLFKILGKNHKIKELKLSNNKINALPKEISNFDLLENFYSSNNIKSKRLPKEFYELKNLNSIEIQGSKIEIIAENLNNLKNLKKLKLHFNKINKLPSDISGLENLRTLILNNNFLTKLPDNLGKLNSLNKLHLHNNQLTYLPNSFVNLTNLDTLSLQDNYLKILPKKIGNLKKLQYLNLEQNMLTTLPGSFKRLTKIKILNITGNNLNKLPKNFGNLKSLEILKGNSNFLKELPESFGNLKSLKSLELSYNNIHSLPKNFGSLKNLEKLYLDNKENHKNRFTKYNHIEGVYKLDTIHKRSARLKNKIYNLPNSIITIQNLKFIDLSNNSLISEDLFSLLKKSSFKNYHLNLSNCNINQLPNSGWDSIKAKSLDVSNNLIQRLPKDIKNSRFLQTLNIRKNKGINTYRKNKAQINLLFEEEGFITKNDQPINNEMAIAYAEVANKKSYSNDYEKVIEYAKRGIEINEKLTLKHLYEDSFIEALYHTKNYKEAIAYANIAIKKDTSQGVRFLNSIIPNFIYKAKSHLALKDTLKAIDTYIVLADNFYKQSWSDVSILALGIKNDSLAKISFEKTFEFYKKYLDKKPKDWGYHFSLLEIYIIANRKLDAKKYYKKLKDYNIKNEDYKVLLEYFKIVLDIVYSNDFFDRKKIINFKSDFLNKNIKFKSWSFELFLKWNELNNLDKNKKDKIKELTTILIKRKST